MNLLTNAITNTELSTHGTDGKNGNKDNNDNIYNNTLFHSLPLPILVEVFSYIPIQDYRDITHLRLISKSIQKDLLPHLIKMKRHFDCSYSGTSATFWNKLFDRTIDGEGEYHDNSGIFVDFTQEKLTTMYGDLLTPDVAMRKEMSMFQGFELLDVTVILDCGRDSCFDTNYISSTSQEDDQKKEEDDRYDEFSKVCSEIAGSCTKSFEDCEKLARKAALKGMFLPLNSIESSSKGKVSHDYYDDDDDDEYTKNLVIATLSISSEDFEQSLIHRRDGHRFYLKVMSQEERQTKDWEEYEDHSYDPLVPRTQDVSLDFRGFLQAQDKNEDVITIKVPMVICSFEDNSSSPFEWGDLLPIAEIENHHQHKGVVEGVAITDGILPSELHQNLIQQIDALAESQELPDYHPHSNNIVRDLVHPALYSYVKGVSDVVSSPNEVSACFWSEHEQTQELSQDPPTSTMEDVDKIKDYWGRTYEASLLYQWLPTYFDVASDGSCKICNYINNLAPREKYKDLYSSLEKLFSHALPLLESVYTYVRHIRKNIFDHGVDVDYGYYGPIDPYDLPSDLYDKSHFNGGYYSLRGRRLQVITKIVDYELGDDQSYEGVWHVEGMSHEEIVATSLYILERDEDIVGGNILFKRAVHQNEAGFIAQSTGQSRAQFIDKYATSEPIPLGRVETLEGRMIAFPNSHIHKVTTLELKKNEDSIKTSKMCKKRRIVVFFLVNPKRRIISTREVPPQQSQAGGTMSLEDALEHRLNLMKERKYVKQDFNIREVELCEH